MPLLTKVNIDENYSLGILKMTTSTNALVKKFINRKLLIFERFQVDVENIKKNSMMGEA
jgi:hypothetical protein